jgi:hypothetical protein
VSKRDTLEKLLKKEIFTDEILRISKIWHYSDEPKRIFDLLKKKRPRRLLTPAMTWTCLRELYEERKENSIITLGGYDEAILWETWRNCLGLTDSKVGHLYISELTGLHMAEKEFNWVGKEDIRNEFRRTLNDNPLDSENKMIPWCINNCVLLPGYIKKNSKLFIDSKEINKVEDLVDLDHEKNINSFVDAVAKWIL